MNTVQKFEAKTLEDRQKNSKLPAFSAGDTVKVNVLIREGERERVQAYEGVCIAKSNDGINSSFTVRKISYGEGVERVFPLYSPRLESVELVRRGSVRRAKLYYMRDRRGKSARIAERTTGHGLEEAAAQAIEEKEAKRAAKKEAKEAKRAAKKAAGPKVKKTKAEKLAEKRAAQKAKKEAKDAAAAAETQEEAPPAEDGQE